jgi:hypothetical protein
MHGIASNDRWEWKMFASSIPLHWLCNLLCIGSIDQRHVLTNASMPCWVQVLKSHSRSIHSKAIPLVTVVC